MGSFTQAELDYLLGERRLARLATVGADGVPHIAPVGWGYNADDDSLEIGGHSMERTKKYRDVLATGVAAVVVDDIASVDPWHVRGVEVRGRAEAVPHPRALIRIYPERIISWGIENKGVGKRQSRTVAGR